MSLRQQMRATDNVQQGQPRSAQPSGPLESCFDYEVVVGVPLVGQQFTLAIVAIDQFQPVLLDRQGADDVVLHLVHRHVRLVQLRLDVGPLLDRRRLQTVYRHDVAIRLQPELSDVVVRVHPHDHLETLLTLVVLDDLVEGLLQLLLLVQVGLLAGLEVRRQQQEPVLGHHPDRVLVDVEPIIPPLGLLFVGSPQQCSPVDDQGVVVGAVGIVAKLGPLDRACLLQEHYVGHLVVEFGQSLLLAELEGRLALDLEQQALQCFGGLLRGMLAVLVYRVVAVDSHHHCPVEGEVHQHHVLNLLLAALVLFGNPVLRLGLLVEVDPEILELLLGEEGGRQAVDHLVAEEDGEAVGFVVLVEEGPDPLLLVGELGFLDESVVAVEVLEDGRTVVVLKAVDVDAREVERGDCQFLPRPTAVRLSHQISNRQACSAIPFLAHPVVPLARYPIAKAAAGSSVISIMMLISSTHFSF